MLRRDSPELGELIDAGVVHQDVEPAKLFGSFGEQSIDVFFFGYVGLNGDGTTSAGDDSGDDAIGAIPARGIVDDDRGAVSGQMRGDGGADAFGGARDNGNFAG
jgi:hypothetical protein